MATLKVLKMAANNLPPIPQDKIGEVQSWRDWFRNLGTYIQQAQGGINVWSILQGGTGANNASGARINLGLGDMAIQSANNVRITGGTITGIPGITQVQADWTQSSSSDPSYIKHKPTGYSGTITTAKLTTLGSNGSMTFTNGILTSQTAAT